jgi:CheY-like chemotaxis protein
MLLRMRGHEVRTASTGEQALAALDEARYEVMLLDLGLPRVDGYEVARRVRERFGATGPKLVALTGWGQDADRARTAEAGFDGHLLKPADPGAVAQVIEQLAPVG